MWDDARHGETLDKAVRVGKSENVLAIGRHVCHIRQYTHGNAQKLTKMKGSLDFLYSGSGMILLCWKIVGSVHNNDIKVYIQYVKISCTYRLTSD